MSRKLRHGLIGCGGCGVGKHLAAYAMYKDDVELGAVYDPDTKRAAAAAEKFSVPKVYGSIDELLADKNIDVVSVVTPTATHAQISIAAMKAGKHVHVEKPIALNAMQAQEMVDVKNATGQKLMVALNNRFTETNQFAKRYVSEGHLGEIYHARCGWRRRRGIPTSGWFISKALGGGGPLIDLGVHFLDLTLYLMGFPMPASVVANTCCKFGNNPKLVGQAKPDGSYDVEDFAAGFARLENGATLDFEFSWASNIDRELLYFELLGTRGGMCLTAPNYLSELKIHTEVAGSLVDITPCIKNVAGWGQNETRHFIDCIKNDVEPMARPEEAVEIMRLIDGIYASSEAKREIILQATGAAAAAVAWNQDKAQA